MPASETTAAQYHFADFTRENYRRLLAIAKARYRFVGYAAADPAPGTVLWRHDIDYSVHAAHALARIEHEEGVKATYFFRLHSEMYNLLEQAVTTRAKAIIELGHAVGLHLDVAWHRLEGEEQLAEVVAWESALLERVLDAPVVAVSYHQPTAVELAWDAVEYAGRVNTYARRFQAQIGYVSDSNGYWRHRRLEDVLAAGSDERLQVLTHPEWWTPDVLAPAQRIARCIEGRAAATRRFYEADLLAFGRPNVGAA
jgi:hypothetical protein